MNSFKSYLGLSGQRTESIASSQEISEIKQALKNAVDTNGIRAKSGQSVDKRYLKGIINNISNSSFESLAKVYIQLTQDYNGFDTIVGSSYGGILSTSNLLPYRIANQESVISNKINYQIRPSSAMEVEDQQDNDAFSLSYAFNVLDRLKGQVTNQSDRVKIAKSLAKKTKLSKNKFQPSDFKSFLQNNNLPSNIKEFIATKYEQIPPTIKEILDSFVKISRTGRVILGKSRNPIKIGQANYSAFRTAKSFIRQIKNTLLLMNTSIQNKTDDFLKARQALNIASNQGNPLTIATKLANRLIKYKSMDPNAVQNKITESLQRAASVQQQSILQKVQQSSENIQNFSGSKADSYREQLKTFNEQYADKTKTVSLNENAAKLLEQFS